MKKIKLLMALVILTFATSFSSIAQSSIAGPLTYQNWTSLPDSPTHLEVSWSTQKCDPLLGADEIRLFVFNESGNPRTADFTLTVSDANQTDVQYSVSGYALTAGQSVKADCSKTIPELVFTVPTGFDPNTLSISIQYNN